LYSEEGLISHVQCKHTDGHVVCPECSIAVFPGYLAHHISSVHSNNTTVRCVVKECGDNFGDFSELRQHVDTTHQPLGLEWCEECSQFVLQLLEHNKVQHEARLHFQPVFGVCLGVRCDWKDCEFMASGQRHLASHVYVKHQKIAIVKCEECGKSVKDFKKHVRVFHDKLKTIPCDYCDKLFLTITQRNHHHKTHTVDKETCKQCGISVSNMRQHVRFVHDKDLPFQCFVTNCGTRFTSNFGFRKHLESVHLMKRETCPICLKSVGDVKKHTQIVHDKVRNYDCPECKKSFQTKTHVKNHYNRVHLGLKDQCPECDKMVQDLRTHTNFVHKKVANFPCDKCNTKCTTSTALKKHISSVHMKEKIECPECDIVVSAAHLGQHVLRTHRTEAAVEDDVSCKECEESFPSKSELIRHIMRIHLCMKEVCTECGQMTSSLEKHTLHGRCSRREQLNATNVKAELLSLTNI